MNVIDKLKKVVVRAGHLGFDQSLREQVQESKLLLAKLLTMQLEARGHLERLRDAEFKVFSQFGDDGIIQYLIRAVGPMPDRFIEFGCSDYLESNTRFLLLNDNWQGLIIDGSDEYIDRVRQESLYWRHDLTAVSAFINRDNINSLFRDNGYSGPIGILSIDIDGNDYWVWEAIDSVDPTIVIAEYNSVLGAKRAVTIPYDPDFVRHRAHYSGLYFGASLKALCLLAERKGFAFVGSNSQGNNAYFVKRDRLNKLKPLTSEEGYVLSRIRDSRNAEGQLSYLSGPARLKEIGDMPVYDIEGARTIRVRELDG